MSEKPRDIDDLQILPIPVLPGWMVRKNRLFDIDPNDARHILARRGLTVWLACFNQDIAWFETLSGSYLLDIGWLPDASEDGQYIIRVIAKNPDAMDERTAYDWITPVTVVRTRCLTELLAHCRALMEAFS